MVGVSFSFREITQNSNSRKKYVPNSSKNWTLGLENTNNKVIILWFKFCSWLMRKRHARWRSQKELFGQRTPFKSFRFLFNKYISWMFGSIERRDQGDLHLTSPTNFATFLKNNGGQTIMLEKHQNLSFVAFVTPTTKSMLHPSQCSKDMVMAPTHLIINFLNLQKDLAMALTRIQIPNSFCNTHHHV